MASFTGKVVGGSLNLRASCSTGSSALASIPNNTTLTVNTVSGQNDWFQTSFNGTSGYVVAQYIAVTSGTGTCTVTTASDPLNIRKTPSTSATVIYTAAKGATLSLLDNSSVAGWFRVSSASGTGWGSSDYLTADGGSGGDYNYPIQAIVDTDKHGVGGTLNMRAYASSNAEVVTTIPDEATIYVQTLSGEWLPAKYNGITGFVMAKFVRGSDEYGGSSSSTYLGQGTVIGGGPLYCRKQPVSGYDYWGQFQEGTLIPIYSCATSGWYETRWPADGSNIGYVMSQYVDLNGGSSGSDSWYSSNSYLSTSQMTVNAQYILNYLRNRGWTKNAVCGMLGNMQVESTINPGIWEGLSSGNMSKGYGLVQWTPATKYTNWADSLGYTWGDMNAQLQRIIYEVTATGNDKQWYSTDDYPMSFAQFIVSTDTPYNLACAFVCNYERPRNPNKSLRGDNATDWYNTLT